MVFLDLQISYKNHGKSRGLSSPDSRWGQKEGGRSLMLNLFVMSSTFYTLPRQPKTYGPGLT